MTEVVSESPEPIERKALLRDAIRTSSLLGAIVCASVAIAGWPSLAIGIAIGTLLGVVLALNLEGIVKFVEHKLQISVLPSDVYYISDLPSDMQWSDVGLIAALAFLFSLIATIYPAWRAARTQPAAALRYE